MEETRHLLADQILADYVDELEKENHKLKTELEDIKQRYQALRITDRARSRFGETTKRRA